VNFPVILEPFPCCQNFLGQALYGTWDLGVPIAMGFNKGKTASTGAFVLFHSGVYKIQRVGAMITLADSTFFLCFAFADLWTCGFAF